MRTKKMRLFSIVLSAAAALCAVPLNAAVLKSNTATLTASAAGSVELKDGTLTLSGSVTKSEVQAFKKNSDVEKVFAKAGAVLPADCSEMFRDFKSQEIDLHLADTSRVTNMRRMFASCSNAETINVSGFDTTGVTDMSDMFRNCESVTVLDLSSFDTYRVSTMSGMFCECDQMALLDITSFDTSSVTDMSWMFGGCRHLPALDLHHFNTSNVRAMNEMFRYDILLFKLDVTSFDTSQVTNMEHMFIGCSSLAALDLSSFDTASVTDTAAMFSDCTCLTTIYAGNWDLSHVSGFDSFDMFNNCPFLKGGNGTVCHPSNDPLVYSRIDGVSTPGYFTDLNSAVGSVELSGDTLYLRGAVTIDQILDYMCDPNVRNIVAGTDCIMPADCSGMFMDWRDYLIEVDLSCANFAYVTNMARMFYNADDLRTVNLSWANTHNNKNTTWMFNGCTNLSSVLLANFDFSSVENTSGMFLACPQLQVLNVSSFDTKSLRRADYMFSDCTRLETIIASDKWKSDMIMDTTGMFELSVNLIGGNGTCYDRDHFGGEYARFDLPGTPGYFTISNNTMYNIWVNGKPVCRQSAADILGDGIFAYDSDTNVLSIKGSFSNRGSGQNYTTENIIRSEMPGLTINVEYLAILRSDNAAFLLSADTVITGSSRLEISSRCQEGISLRNGAELIMDGVSGNVHSEATAGICGDPLNQAEKLIVRDSNITARSEGVSAILYLSSLRTEGCKVTSPENGYYDTNRKAALNQYGNTARVFVIQPNYDLLIDGTKVTPANKEDVLGNGVFAYDPAEKTLHIHGDYHASGTLIDSQIPNMTISTDSDSVLSSDNSYCVKLDTTDLQESNRPTFTGAGRLYLRGHAGIYVVGNNTDSSAPDTALILRDAKLDVRTYDNAVRVRKDINSASVSGDLIAENSDLHAETVVEYSDYHDWTSAAVVANLRLDGCSVVYPVSYRYDMKAIYLEWEYSAWGDDSGGDEFYYEGPVYGVVVDGDTGGFATRVIIRKNGGSAENYDINIAGTQVTSDNAWDVLGDKSFSYEHTERKLTVNHSYSTTEDNRFIIGASEDQDHLNIYIPRNVKLSTKNANTILLDCDTTFTGPGRLTVNSEASGIYCEDCKVTVDNADIDVNARRYGFTSDDDDRAELTVIKSKLRVNGGVDAMSDFRKITLTDCEILKPENAVLKSGTIYEADGTTCSKNVLIADGYADLTGDTLTLYGRVSKSDIWDYRDSDDVKHVVAAPGCVMPSDCSELFLGFEWYWDDPDNNHWSSLVSVDLSKADTSNVRNMDYMFCGKSGAELEYSDYRLSNLTSINLTGIDTSNVRSMEGMFLNSEVTSLDLSSFDTKNVEFMGNMFYGCINLETIYASDAWSTSSVEYIGDMFTGCSKLKGGNGTAYSYNCRDESYACIDKPNQPGYLTYKSFRRYDLYVAGRQVTEANASDILGNGVFSYDSASNTLHIHGDYTYNHGDLIQTLSELTISTDSDSTLTADNRCISNLWNHDFYPVESITVTGSGRLSLRGYVGIDLETDNFRTDLILRDADVDIRTVGTSIVVFSDQEGGGHNEESRILIQNSRLYAESDIGEALATPYPVLEDSVLVEPDGAHVGYLGDGDEPDYTFIAILDGNGNPAKKAVIRKASDFIAQITAQPQTVTASAGTSVQFTVGASGEELAYQWQFNTGAGWKNAGTADAKTPTLHIDAAHSRDGYQYRCLVSACGGTPAESEAAMLKVKPTITKQPTDCIVFGGQAEFSVEAEGKGLIYQWQYKTGSSWKNGSDKSARSAVWHFDPIVQQDGMQVRCIVKSASGASTISNVVTMKIKPVITKQPESVTAASGQTAEFSVSAVGMGLIYQWQFNTGAGWKNAQTDDAKTDTLHIEAAHSRDGYQYRCIVKGSNTIGTISDPVTLKVKPTITEQPKTVTAVAGTDAVFTLTAEGKGVIYQWQYKSGSSWKNVTTSDAKTNTLTLEATVARDGNQYRCITKSASGAATISDVVTLKVKPTITKQPADITAAAGTDAVFTLTAEGKSVIYQWQYKSGSSWKNVTTSDAKTNTLTLEATVARDGNQYRCITKSASGAATISDVVMLKIKPTITKQPADITAAAGTSAVFVTAASGNSVIYQWQYKSGDSWKNVTTADGKTPVLTLEATVARDGNQYRCITKSASDAVTISDVVMLKVKPTITKQPVSYTGAAGTTAKFTVTATGKSLIYQWQYKSGDSWKNVTTSDAKTNTLTLEATSARNGKQYRCIVKSASGAASISDAVTLTLK